MLYFSRYDRVIDEICRTSRRVSGLGARRAANVIEWRSKNGPFTNREQLTMVKMIGEKTYEQCCGFLRVLPETAFEEKYSFNSLFGGHRVFFLLKCDRTFAERKLIGRNIQKPA